MLRQLRPAIVVLAVFSAVLGLAYPLLVTGIGQVAFGHQANGSLLHIGGQVRGSELLAQPFTGDQWFQPRPSAGGYDATNSGGSNLGPTNPDLLRTIEQRTADYRVRNGLGPDVPVPVDAVTASGSGLDPDISTRNAALQAPRVAAVRGLPVAEVNQLVSRYTEHRPLGVLGETVVNVVRLNAALEEMGR